MAPPLLTLKDIAITFGSRPLLDGAELNLLPGERACLVGRNGSGKSTLLKIAAGMIEPDGGERFAQPSARFLYLPQEADFIGYETVFDYVASAFAPSEEPHSAHRLIAELGLEEGADPRLLSGGEARKAAIARVLAPQPDALLLDEPTNHLDLPAIEWLENELAQTKSAILMISHDRRFLERLSRTTIWIDRGQARRLPRGFSEFEAWRDDLIEQEDLAAQENRAGRKLDV